MEIEKTDPSTQKVDGLKTKSKSVSLLKKIDPQTAKHLAALKEKANKKDFGKTVRERDIIAVGLKLIEDRHLKDLQASSLTDRDRLLVAHQDYVKHHGKITVDQFIGKLLNGEVISK